MCHDFTFRFTSVLVAANFQWQFSPCGFEEALRLIIHGKTIGKRNLRLFQLEFH